jgi:RND family efflux transporter MFP subunit
MSRPRTNLLLWTLLAAGWATACRHEAPAPVARAVPVRTVPAETRDLDEVLEATGTLRPRAQVQLTAEVAARLVRVLRDEGASVREGDVLAVLDDTDYRLTLDRARAAQAVADANQAHAVVEKERADNLLKTGGITDKDHLAAQVGLRVAEAALAQARAEVAIAAQQQTRCQMKAPFGGRVARRLPDPGTLLAPGMPVFTLVDDSVLEFRGSLPSVEYGRVPVGAPVEIFLDALPGQRLAGRVTRVTPLVDERTRSFEIVAQVPGRRDVAGGIFARARVRLGRLKGAIVVPPAALLRDGARPDRADLFVVGDGKAQRRTVTLGVEQAAVIQVTKGLAQGEVVVLDPPSALASGAAVAPQKGER